MLHQSLYRRFRPQRFAEVVGQSHLVRALRNAVREDRVGHAYLLSGPRGTGKTSTARILAKALNCEELSDEGEPCERCNSCIAVAAGTSLDLIELDAASNNSVNHIRDMTEKAALVSAGRRKVYLLDEVHMLSAAASNALLKTLEEPPAHVVFILATTDPNKVLPTIRSRTQQFELSLVGAEEMAPHVRAVAEAAGVPVDDAVVDYVTERGAGSVRDALSALDTVLAAGGIPDDRTDVNALVQALASADLAATLIAVAGATSAGVDARDLAERTARRLRDMFLVSAGVEPAELPRADIDSARELSDAMGRRRNVRALEALGSALAQMPQSADRRLTLETALVSLLADDALGAAAPPAAAAAPASAPGAAAPSASGPAAARAAMAAAQPPPPPAAPKGPAQAPPPSASADQAPPAPSPPEAPAVPAQAPPPAEEAAPAPPVSPPPPTTAPPPPAPAAVPQQQPPPQQPPPQQPPAPPPAPAAASRQQSPPAPTPQTPPVSEPSASETEAPPVPVPPPAPAAPAPPPDADAGSAAASGSAMTAAELQRLWESQVVAKLRPVAAGVFRDVAVVACERNVVTVQLSEGVPLAQARRRSNEVEPILSALLDQTIRLEISDTAAAPSPRPMTADEAPPSPSTPAADDSPSRTAPVGADSAAPAAHDADAAENTPVEEAAATADSSAAPALPQQQTAATGSAAAPASASSHEAKVQRIVERFPGSVVVRADDITT